MGDFKFGVSKWVPFRDKEICERIRNIKREDITKHPNPDLKIRIVKDSDFTFLRVEDIFLRIKEASEEAVAEVKEKVEEIKVEVIPQEIETPQIATH